MASGSHFAPIGEDDFELDDPDLTTHLAPSQAHICLASPTATLQACPEIQWTYGGVEYNSLKDAICTLAASLNITNEAYIDILLRLCHRSSRVPEFRVGTGWTREENCGEAIGNTLRILRMSSISESKIGRRADGGQMENGWRWRE
ncbi:hypothetical protein BD309DRAFT_983193 [Dichomitus squalens]|nr:hypothetical protein BD309DRAFT_983193 [Dichomitus squalens]